MRGNKEAKPDIDPEARRSYWNHMTFSGLVFAALLNGILLWERYSGNSSHPESLSAYIEDKFTQPQIGLRKLASVLMP